MKYAQLATVIVVLSFLAACGKQEPASAPNPGIPKAPSVRPTNVVLIILDTLRADRVEALRNGTPVMPHLAALANESLYFPNAVSPCSWTKPAMASILTSTYADVHGVHVGARLDGGDSATSDVLPQALETMAEYFGAQGYDTFCYQTNGNLTQESGFNQGFADDRFLFFSNPAAEYVSDGAIDILGHMKTPFFMYAHYMDPHTQYLPHPEYDDIFPSAGGLTEDDRAVLANKNSFNAFFWDEVNDANGKPRNNGTPRLSDTGKAEVERLYDGECRYMDEHVHRYIEAVKARDPLTVFVITSDHGEEFWEHDGVGHGLTLYDDQITVPLIIHGPGIPSERRERPVGTLGILPTLASYLQTAPNPAWQGEDVIGTETPGPIFALTHGSQTNQRYYIDAVIEGGKKFIEDYGRGFAALFDAGRPEVEQVDQLVDEPWRANPYRLKVSRWREENRKHRAELLPGAAEPGSEVEKDTVQLSPEDQERLAALGYLDAGASVDDGTEEAAEATLPNIALIVIDTLRQDRIHGERGGIPIMPNLSALAKESWDFQQCTAQASWTKPSVTSILSGLYTDTHGVQFGVQAKLMEGQDMRIQVVPDAVPMAAEYFRELGHTAIGFQTNQHLQCQYGYGRGFDDDCAAYTNLKWARADKVTDASVEALKEVDGPFFLYAHYFDPHGPYDPPTPYDTMFADFPGLTESDDQLRERGAEKTDYYLDHLLYALGAKAERETNEFSMKGRESIRYFYDGECRFTDTEVQRLLNYIDTRFDNTIVVITADHGEEFWEHGGIGHAKTVYEEVINVPLIVRIPGEAPRVIASPVETIDILPTLAASLNAAPRDEWQGRDLSLVSDEGDDVPVFSLTRGSIPKFELHLESVRQGDLKLIQNILHLAGRPPFELYNLDDDPTEQNDLSEDDQESVQRLHGVLKQHRVEAAISYPIVYEGTDEDTIEALRALGYLHDDESDIDEE